MCVAMRAGDRRSRENIGNDLVDPQKDRHGLRNPLWQVANMVKPSVTLTFTINDT
jgi:hypothetical protein